MNAKHFERGSTIVETAIVMSILLALIFSVIDFGRALYTYGFVGTIAREGARWAIVRGAECSNNSPNLNDCNATAARVQSYVQSLSEGATVASKIAVNTNTSFMWPGTGCPVGSASKNAPGCNVVVQVTYPFSFMLPFMPTSAISMTSTSEMVIQQ